MVFFYISFNSKVIYFDVRFYERMNLVTRMNSLAFNLIYLVILNKINIICALKCQCVDVKCVKKHQCIDKKRAKKHQCVDVKFA